MSLFLMVNNSSLQDFSASHLNCPVLVLFIFMFDFRVRSYIFNTHYFNWSISLYRCTAERSMLRGRSVCSIEVILTSLEWNKGCYCGIEDVRVYSWSNKCSDTCVCLERLDKLDLESCAGDLLQRSPPLLPCQHKMWPEAWGLRVWWHAHAFAEEDCRCAQWR